MVCRKQILAQIKNLKLESPLAYLGIKHKIRDLGLKRAQYYRRLAQSAWVSPPAPHRVPWPTKSDPRAESQEYALNTATYASKINPKNCFFLNQSTRTNEFKEFYCCKTTTKKNLCKKKTSCPFCLTPFLIRFISKILFKFSTFLRV